MSDEYNCQDKQKGAWKKPLQLRKKGLNIETKVEKKQNAFK